jgi:hypothetical protein
MPFNPRRDGGKKELVTGEQLYFRSRPVIGWPQGWRWRATASGG